MNLTINLTKVRLYNFICLILLYSTISPATIIYKDDPWLLLHKTSWPYISGDSFRDLADHIVDPTRPVFHPIMVKKGDIVFVKTDFLGIFFKECHPQIRNKYILITHNSDKEAPGDYSKFLDDEKLYAWFGQNPSINYHKKFIPIPIGIANSYNGICGDITIFEKFRSKNKYKKKDNLLYMNFVIENNSKERRPVYQMFIKKNFCKHAHKLSFEKYLDDLQRSKFVLSPPGNGLDCHRTYESIYMGACPVVVSSSLNSLFKDLPVLIINKWEHVTAEFLKKKYNELNKKSYNSKKLFMNYWKKIIKSCQKRLIKQVDSVLYRSRKFMN